MRTPDVDVGKKWMVVSSRLGGFFALRPGDRLDGAERSVEPGLLSGLDFIQSQTQVVLQVLGEEGETHVSLFCQVTTEHRE